MGQNIANKLEFSIRGKIVKVDYYLVLLVFLTVIGFGLRIAHITQYSFWFDEAYTLYISHEMGFFDMIRTVLLYDNHPPGYYTFMFFWFQLFPANEFWARIPSVFFGTACIPGIYYVGKEMTDEKTGLIASFLITISAFHIKYSQEARMYSMLVFFSLLSIYYYLLLVKTNNTKYCKFSMFYLFITLYVHIYSVLLFISLTILIISQTDLRSIWIKYSILVSVLYLPYLYYAYMRLLSIQEDFWIIEPNPDAVLKALIAYFYSNDLFHAVLILFFINTLFGKHPSLNKIQINQIVLPLLVILYIPYLFSYYVTPIFVDKYSIVSSVFLFIGIGKMIDIRSKIRFVNLISMFIIIQLAVAPISYIYHDGTYDDVKGAMAYIDENHEPNQILVFNRGGLIIRYLANYYLENDLDQTDFPMNDDEGVYRSSWEIEVTETNVKGILNITDGYWGIWLIYIRSSDYYYQIVETLTNDKWVNVDHQKFNGIELFLFKIQQV